MAGMSDPFQSSDLDIRMQSFSSDGVKIAYIDLAPTGDVSQHRTVVLVHGFASSHMTNWVNTQWTKTLTHAGYRVVALDDRGHGESEKLYDPAAYSSDIMAEDVRRLMDHLDIPRAAVMGYSMGARISAHLALAHPRRLDALLLGGRMSPAMKGTIVDMVRQIAASRLRQRVQNAVYLVAVSSQFNVGR